METQISEETVHTVLDSQTARSIDEITREIWETDKYCPECGQITIEYDSVRDDVREVLQRLISNGDVTSTPDWEYRLSR